MDQWTSEKHPLFPLFFKILRSSHQYCPSFLSQLCFKIQLLIHLPSYVSIPTPPLPGLHSLCLLLGNRSSMPVTLTLAIAALGVISWIVILHCSRILFKWRVKRSGFQQLWHHTPPLPSLCISGPQLLHLQKQAWLWDFWELKLQPLIILSVPLKNI